MLYRRADNPVIPVCPTFTSASKAPVLVWRWVYSWIWVLFQALVWIWLTCLRTTSHTIAFFSSMSSLIVLTCREMQRAEEIRATRAAGTVCREQSKVGPVLLEYQWYIWFHFRFLSWALLVSFLEYRLAAWKSGQECMKAVKKAAGRVSGMSLSPKWKMGKQGQNLCITERRILAYHQSGKQSGFADRKRVWLPCVGSRWTVDRARWMIRYWKSMLCRMLQQIPTMIVRLYTNMLIHIIYRYCY